ncbi:MAG TPA: alanyl-tRNA editing protein [Anaerolineae bacterium]|nr:alanyl-tRNA editing protein [Anaerolineae bacterium]
MTPPYSERLFYADPYLTHFHARVVERLTWEGRPAVVLDRTAFYPTSGGQPADRGTLSGVDVADVVIRNEDGAILHLLEENRLPDQVTGRIDWARRFDHMQQHTGQHLLSAACERLLDADTVSFHLGAEVSTIDLNRPRIPPEAIEEVESLVNQVIWEDRPVTTRFVPADEVADLPLRRPPQVEGPIRLVEVADFDLNPCGGTHVARTGEIGLLKVLRLDYRGEETRVEFVCGGRALRDYRRKNRIVHRLSSTLTVGQDELEEAITRLRESLKATRRELRAAREEMAEDLAKRLLRSAPPGPPRIIWAVLEGYEPADLRSLAQRIIATPDTVVLLAAVRERTHLCVARSEGLEIDAPTLLHSVCDLLGGRGGGRPNFAQGSAPTTDRRQVEDALRRTASALGT